MTARDELIDRVGRQAERSQCKEDAIALIVEMAQCHDVDEIELFEVQDHVQRAHAIAQRWAENQEPE